MKAAQSLLRRTTARRRQLYRQQQTSAITVAVAATRETYREPERVTQQKTISQFGYHQRQRLAVTISKQNAHQRGHRTNHTEQQRFVHSVSASSIDDSCTSSSSLEQQEAEEDDEYPQQLLDDNDRTYHASDDDLAFENYDDDYDNHYSKRSHHHRKQPKKNDNDNKPQRLWLDPKKTPLVQDRVSRFVNSDVGTLHHLDVILSAVDLIQECGKLRSLEGMKWAHDVLDRVLDEKHHVNEQVQLQRVVDGDNDKQPMDDEKEERIVPIFISARHFQVLLFGWSKQSRHSKVAPQRMREVLELMIQEAEWDDDFRLQQAVPYRKPIYRLVHSSSDQQQQDNDDRKQELYETTSCQPTVDTYNTLLQGLVEASHRSMAAASEAEHVLAAMEGMHQKKGWHTKPNTKSFSLVLNAFSKTKHKTAGDRAEAVLQRMVDYHEQEKIAYQEEYGVEYDTSKDGTDNKRKIVTPDAVAYTTVIQAHGNSNARGSAQKALRLFREAMASNHVQPDAFLFANTIQVFSTSISKLNHPDDKRKVAETAEELLWEMVELFRSSNENVKNGKNTLVVPFNACMNTWVQSQLPDAALRAEAILTQMLDPESDLPGGVTPTTVSFNTCMQGWAKAARNDPEAPTKAMDLLELMTGLLVEPDTISFTSVMNAYAESTRSDKVSQTRHMLDRLIENYDSARHFGGSRSKQMKLSAVPFTVVLNATAYSPSRANLTPPVLPDGNDKSGMTTTATMDPFGVHDDDLATAATSPDNSIDDLATAATSPDNSINKENNNNGDRTTVEEMDPFSVALDTYTQLRDDVYGLDVQLDHFAIAAMIQVVDRHTHVDSTERRHHLQSLLQDARATGNISSLVIRNVERALEQTTSRGGSLLQGWLQLHTNTLPTSVNAFPGAWTVNVPPKYRRLRERGGGRKKKNSASTPHSSVSSITEAA